MIRIKVGKKIRFDPYEGMRSYGIANVRGEVVGKIIDVYPEHRYFTAEYTVDDEKKFKISFKFDDVFGEKPSVHFV